jgi:Protein of unknown function (DUF3775)
MAFSNVLLRLLALAVELQAARRAQPALPGVQAGRLVAIKLSDIPVSPPLPQATAFREYCKGLTPAHLFMATVVMYAGRGDFGETFDVLDRYEQMSNGFRSPDWAAQQMLGKVPLPEYLAAGIRLLDEMRCNIDGLC